MCGASQQQNDLSAEETQAYKDAEARTAEQYKNQQAIYAPLSAQFQSIFAKGPNQRGFSTSESQDLNATAVEGTARNYKQAATAVGEHLAAEGGGTNPLPTGAEEQLRQEVANSAAGQESSEEEQIQQADFAAGHNLWTTSAAGLEGIATGQDPLGYENAATNAGNSANSEANAIEEANNSWINAAIGAAGSVGGMAAGSFVTKHG